MLITLSHRAAICQSVSEVQLTGVAPLGAVSHRFKLIFNYYYYYYYYYYYQVQYSQEQTIRSQTAKIYIFGHIFFHDCCCISFLLLLCVSLLDFRLTNVIHFKKVFIVIYTVPSLTRLDWIGSFHVEEFLYLFLEFSQFSWTFRCCGVGPGGKLCDCDQWFSAVILWKTCCPREFRSISAFKLKVSYRSG